jgi:hypothetical protein
VKLPWCKFWPRDWISDPALRLCSYGARGLWADLLCYMLMNEARRGYLELSGKPLKDPAQIARVTGGTARLVAKLLSELEAANVFSRDADGCIFSRRMVADESQRAEGREHGLRGGNPSLTVNKRVNPPGYPSPLTKPLNSEAEAEAEANEEGRGKRESVPRWSRIKNLKELIEKKRKCLPQVADRNLYPEQHGRDMEKWSAVSSEIKMMDAELTKLQAQEAGVTLSETAYEQPKQQTEAEILREVLR